MMIPKVNHWGRGRSHSFYTDKGGFQFRIYSGDHRLDPNPIKYYIVLGRLSIRWYKKEKP